MKLLAILLAAICASACSNPAPPAEPQAADRPTCPKIASDTPWDLIAKRGIDFWTCDYAFAVTDKPLFSAVVSNHVGAPSPLKFYTVYPDESQLAWFREMSDDLKATPSYWAFRSTGSRTMGIIAINAKATSYPEFKQKAELAALLE